VEVSEKDYVLGTHDEEIERLGLQHRVWRPRASDAWRRAGFSTGQTILDVGCGPGYASVDLAKIVGPAGRIVAVDRSRRFLDALESRCRQREIGNVEAHEMDLSEGAIPVANADGAWARWIFAFVPRPRGLLERVARTLKPGGVFVSHEYFEYATWRLMPRSPELEELVGAVMDTWHASGGEPDIGREIPVWLQELGFTLRELNPIIDVVTPSSFVWQWPKAFVEVGLARMVELARFTPERASEISDAFSARESDPHSLLVTPGVLEIIAVKAA
jgi:SAM-dependent methyltransferase